MRLALALAAAALAAATLAAQAAAAAERLVTEPVPASRPWVQITDQANEKAWIREQVPAGQTGDEHDDILVAQGFLNLQAKATPSLLLQRIVAGAQHDCTAVSVNGPTERVEDGHATAYIQIYCAQENGKTYGVAMLFKAIAGQEALYVVLREVRTPATQTPGGFSFDKAHAGDAKALTAHIASADRYIADRVYLCGAGSTNPKCAAGR
jgi:hypothetical protein